MSNLAQNNRRVVITGMGVITSNGHGLKEFEKSLRNSISGIRFVDKMAELNFRCHVAGKIQNLEAKLGDYFTPDDLLGMDKAMCYTSMAGMDAWRDAGLIIDRDSSKEAHSDTGCIVGCGISGVDVMINELAPKVNSAKIRRAGSTLVERIMASGPSAKLGGILGIGGQLTSNSSACTTGVESVIDGFYKIKYGLFDRALVGSGENDSIYVHGAFDAMRVLNSNNNDAPEKASRPLSQSAGGFIPGSGSGSLFLETLESAKQRNARIYTEIIGASINCGGQRQGGSMTAPNMHAVQKCIRSAVDYAQIKSTDIDYINGHLTATMADPFEINNWKEALSLEPSNFPYVNSTKSLIGHALGGAGSIELVATILQMHNSFIHKSLNCEDIHEKILPYEKSIVRETREHNINIAAKASFGFGDVNGCVILKKWDG